MHPKIIRINFDGACRNVPGQNMPMGIGIAVFFDEVYKEDKSEAIHVQPSDQIRGTSNVSEWEGCVEAMAKASDFKSKYPEASIVIFSDSQLIVNQFNGDWEVKDNAFKTYRIKAVTLSNIAGINKITWTKRTGNKEADKLSKAGLRKESGIARFELGYYD